MGKSKIEKLREKLHRAIEYYGRDSPIVLKISQELDMHIVEELKKCKNKKRPLNNNLVF
ncbi:aspartyl-phosphate phosphatase Spo0E family protein [Clostridium botulinum]|nr:aspartyl-phosphate phosphatase Spo0E family protein [Clostridium botulinum]MBY6813368.1 aspartyl-phosphate phosphatase Spo0E family protein [Clostridium botulinum]MBY6821898.1 aspartyl-phosphate phosphatase Spo0E family protein [Clostridium botulinum]MBY7008858.1 aspartyl-phosphate phosphatase Spo0E family protein [Clostridium botulinum]NFH73747.1 aspartyl-phosphate phosphatase Spo0E family protein [Clostridium botulinum]